MNKAYYYDYDTKSIKEKDVKGQVIYLTQEFNSQTVTLTASCAKLIPNDIFVDSDKKGICSWNQLSFVIDAPLDIEEKWDEYNFIPTKPIKAGDTVYVYFGWDYDCYGICIAGVFSRRLTSDEVKQLEIVVTGKSYIEQIREDLTAEIKVEEK